MTQGPTLVHNDRLNEIARRLAAAYVSYQAGYVGVDILLKRMPETASEFWYQIAKWVEKAFLESRRVS